jgi:hypothetical protein
VRLSEPGQWARRRRRRGPLGRVGGGPGRHFFPSRVPPAPRRFASPREDDAKQRNSYGCTVLRSLLLSFLPSPVLRPFLFWLATGREIYRGRVELVLDRNSTGSTIGSLSSESSTTPVDLARSPGRAWPGLSSSDGGVRDIC